MLVDAWLKMVGALTPDDMKLLKARGCASELFALLDAIENLAVSWQRTEPGLIHKRDWADFQSRLEALWAGLRES